jgi:hypothetical protein
MLHGPEKYYDAEHVHQAFGAGQISAWERDFYIGNIGKVTLSEKQAEIKAKIERKIR